MNFKAILLCKLRDSELSIPGDTKWLLDPFIELVFGGSDYEILEKNKPILFAARAKACCKPYKLIVDGNNDCFEIHDLRFGKNSQMVMGSIPCVIFSPEMSKEMSLDSLNEGQLAILTVVRVK
jgi:hypothetical protein